MSSEDFSKQYRDFAIFIPAVSEMYARYVATENPKREPDAPLTREDLNFFNPATKLYYLPKVLYSAGQAAKVDIKDAHKDMVMSRDPSWGTTVVGDSGGFQIETGAIRWEGDKTRNRMMNWLENFCDWAMILDFPTGSITRRGNNSIYLEYVFDEKGKPVYDIDPVLNEDGSQQIDEKGKPVFSKKPRQIEHLMNFWFCLDRTMENNDYFIANRTPGKTRFLNVLQGRYHNYDVDEEWVHNLDFVNLPRLVQKAYTNSLIKNVDNPDLCEVTQFETQYPEYAKQLDENPLHRVSEVDAWYKYATKYATAFNDRSFEGWSLAGKHKEDFALTLRRIVILLHDGLLKDKKWMHFLGMGKLRNGCVYTTIQRMIREHELGNKEFTISYDVSSPFTTAAYGNVITGYNLDKDAWSIQSGKCDGHQFIGSREDLHGMVDAEFDDFGLYVDPDTGVRFKKSNKYRIVRTNDVDQDEQNIKLFLECKEAMKANGFIGKSDAVTGEVIKARAYLKNEDGTYKSPIAGYLKMGDICVNNELIDKEIIDPDTGEKKIIKVYKYTSTWDVASYAYIMNHNVYMHFKAVIEAQNLYDLPFEEAKNHVPLELLQIKDLVQRILSAPRAEALELIKTHKTTLQQLSGEGGASISAIEDPSLFASEATTWEKPKGRKKEEKPVETKTTFDDLFAL